MPGIGADARRSETVRRALSGVAAALAAVALLGCTQLDARQATATGTAAAPTGTVGPAAPTGTAGPAAASAPGAPAGSSGRPTVAVSTRPLGSTCQFLADVNAAATSADSAEQGLGLLRMFEPRFDDALAQAPPAASQDVRLVLAAARRALHDSDLAELSTDDVAQAGARLDQLCGLSQP